MKNGFLILISLFNLITAKPIERNYYGTDDQLSIKLEDSSYNEDKSKDIVNAKDLIEESEKPSFDEKRGDKRSVDLVEISGDENLSGDATSENKDVVKVVAASKVEIGEKRDEFERGLIDDPTPNIKQEDNDNKVIISKKRSHKSTNKGKHGSDHLVKNEKKHDVKPDSKKRNATVGGGGWWNCDCCNNGGHQVEHKKEQHHECAQHNHQECEGCHGHHEKGQGHEHHDTHSHKEHGYEMYEEWGEHAGKAHGHEGHHECCEQGHHAHECEKVMDCGHKECCHQEEHHQPCCHPNCCQVDIGNNPCCGGIGIGK